MRSRIDPSASRFHLPPRTLHLVFLFLIFALFITSCGPAETPTQTLSPTEAATEPPPPTPLPPTGTPPSEPAATEPSAPTGTPAEELAAEPLPCMAASQVSLIQTPVPEPTATEPVATATAAPPTPTPRPAPQEDRVGFPENYQEEFKLMFVYDRVDNRQVRIVCGNEVASTVQSGEPFPHGSILVMETWRAKLDENGNVVEDQNGRFVRESLSGLFVMRKEPGFGEAYQNLRTGEWEYVAYRPDGSTFIPPQNTANCAACHQGAGAGKDWLFRADVLFFDEDRYAAAAVHEENEIAMNSVAFFPRTFEIKAGTTLTWNNDDVVPHTATAGDGSFNSGPLSPGDRFSFTFDTPGTFEYLCSLHPEQMRAVIEVTEE